MRKRNRDLANLLLAIVTIVLVWTVVLPTAANRPVIKRRIQWLQQQRIDPNAMYYTDLEIMQEILDRGSARSARGLADAID